MCGLYSSPVAFLLGSWWPQAHGKVPLRESKFAIVRRIQTCLLFVLFKVPGKLVNERVKEKERCPIQCTEVGARAF